MVSVAVSCSCVRWGSVGSPFEVVLWKRPRCWSLRAVVWRWTTNLWKNKTSRSVRQLRWCEQNQHIPEVTGYQYHLPHLSCKYASKLNISESLASAICPRSECCADCSHLLTQTGLWSLGSLLFLLTNSVLALQCSKRRQGSIVVLQWGCLKHDGYMYSGVK